MLPKKPDAHNCMKSRFNGMNIKIAIKEKKADKRKEKSRVAAQIRRNKESQTLILLQNALPICLPSPNQMLEKSIVIRIAGQTLFLLKSLDQVLGMTDWLTVPLISSNFLAFFTDNIGQIVYASPNIQSVLDQHHWSNLIGISIFDIMDFKSRWPMAGDVVKLKLLTNPNPTCDFKTNKPQVTSMSFSPSMLYQNSSRSTVVSKFNVRSNLSMINQFIPPCSIYTVWCSTNISHTNSKLKLLLLRQIQTQPSSLSSSSISSPSSSLSTSNYSDSNNHLVVPNSESLPFDRSLSWPLIVNQMKSEHSDTDAQSNQSKCVQKGFIVSIHDRKYNFEAVSSEFCRVVEETENDLTEQNLLDIIHIEDVIRVKSFLDSIIEKRDNNMWTPVYRILCANERYCMVKSLAKQFSTSCSQSIILHHQIIRTDLTSEYATKFCAYEFKKKLLPSKLFISAASSPKRKIQSISKSTPYIMSQNSSQTIFQKRKSTDQSCDNEKFSHITENMSAFQKFFPGSHSESEKYLEKLFKPHILTTNKDLNINNSILDKDPFLPTCFERRLIYKSKSDDYKTNRPKSIFINQMKLNSKSNLTLKDKFENESNCSASHSLESCVLTSPSPDSVGISIDDQFLWDFPESLCELTQSNHWFDEQYQNDLELILPI